MHIFTIDYLLSDNKCRWIIIECKLPDNIEWGTIPSGKCTNVEPGKY